jgi:predicted glycoside hydrolase/deacetylase ChbG (UPF0249 family)/putative flippase GtrA
MSDAVAFRSTTRFAIVGCTNFLVSCATFYVCFHALRAGGITALPWPLDALRVQAPAAAIANVLAYLAGMVNSFVLNRTWTFAADGDDVGRQALRFAIVNLASLGVSTLVVHRFVDVLGYPALSVWVPLTVVVMVVNYLGCRYWAFARAEEERQHRVLPYARPQHAMSQPGRKEQHPVLPFRSSRSPDTRLIVHADDFGLTPSINRGVVDAHRRGILTSTSLIVNGAAFEDAVALALANPTLDVGVHLTLTEERPLATGTARSGLVDRDGCFPPTIFAFAARYLRGAISLDAIRDELAAQIETALGRGLAVSHLDGHQHVHALPGIAGVVAELARACDIHAVRHPAERLQPYMTRDWRRAPRLAGQLALGACAALSPLRDLRVTDDFAGFYFGGRMNETNLLSVIDGLRPGRTTELMCHPGDDDRHDPYGHWGYAWSEELAALTSARVRERLDARGVRLVSYRDL